MNIDNLNIPSQQHYLPGSALDRLNKEAVDASRRLGEAERNFEQNPSQINKIELDQKKRMYESAMLSIEAYYDKCEATCY